MLTDVEVENFQSLRKLSLRLGRFTVITGATGSGKSAVIRAIRLAAFNARGNAFITRGQRTCKAGLGSQDEDWFAAIERGVTRGKDAYRIARKSPGGETDSSVEVQPFTKLAGGVPEQVTEAHRLTELNFAAQFDTPFLLAQSAGEIARTLGRLTNVTVLFEAARECATRKQRLAGRLKARQADLERLEGEAARFASLPARRKAVQEAEEAMQAAQQLEVRTAALGLHIARAKAAQGRLETAAAAVPAVPDLAELDALMNRRQRLADLLETIRGRHQEVVHWQHKVSQYEGDAKGAETELAELLNKAGFCPTCGRPVGVRHRQRGEAQGEAQAKAVR